MANNLSIFPRLQQAHEDFLIAQSALDQAVKYTFPVGCIVQTKIGHHFIQARVKESLWNPDPLDLQVENIHTGKRRKINIGPHGNPTAIVHRPRYMVDGVHAHRDRQVIAFDDRDDAETMLATMGLTGFQAIIIDNQEGE